MLGLLAALAINVNPGVLLFNAGDSGWLVMSRSGEQVKRSNELGGMEATEAALSRDGKKWGFISDERLYLWQQGWPSPREVPRSGDVLETPSFSPDGVWLYFVQNDFETMRQGWSMRYSQLWRVRSSGGTPTKLTNSAGCHMWPTPLSGGRVVFTHATCHGGRAIDLLSPSTKEKQLLAADQEHGETAIDTEGKRAIFIRDSKGELLVFELDIETRKETLWAHLPWRAVRMRPAWGPDGNTIWIQNTAAVWRVSRDGSTTEHLRFTDLKGAP